MSIRKHDALIRYAFKALDCMNEISSWWDVSDENPRPDMLAVSEITKQIKLFHEAEAEYEKSIDATTWEMKEKRPND